jgi:hypothetical protein
MKAGSLWTRESTEHLGHETVLLVNFGLACNPASLALIT